MAKANLTWLEASDVSDYLISADSVGHGDIVDALINAMNRIAILEAKVARLTAASDASKGRTPVKVTKLRRP